MSNFSCLLNLIFYLNLIKIQSTPIINLYYETLCPYCGQFITTQLKSLIDKGNMANVVVNLIPYGIVNETFNITTGLYDYECHHGPNECEGNIMSGCFIDILGRVNSYKYLICLENLVKRYKGNFTKTLEMCTKDNNNLFKLITECATGKRGNEIMHENGAKTPQLPYTPYITLNGWHMTNDETLMMNNLYDFLCSNYKDVCK